MSRQTLRNRTNICQLCEFLLPRQLPARQRWRPQRVSRNIRSLTTTAINQTKASQVSRPSGQLASKPQTAKATNATEANSKVLAEAEVESHWKEVKAGCDTLLSSGKAPSEEDTVLVLTKCNWLAELLVFDQSSPPKDGKPRATSALLSLDSASVKKPTTPGASANHQSIINELSRLAFSVVEHPPVFISPKVLEIYTKIQANLRKPETFPAVFQMYANKPLLQEGSPTRYAKQNPNKISNAVPGDVADRALQTAIDTKQLVIAMDIIESSYTTKAFLRAKLIRVCLIPAIGVALVPVAAYTVASQLALFQTTMDSEVATRVAFTGIIAYTFFTGTIGVIAVTTANDQMDRVTWAPGMPLRQRWMREEERAAIDKIAGAWGFRETWRRGEEEGEDWEALREWIGRKGMILDRVELMEGME